MGGERGSGLVPRHGKRPDLQRASPPLFISTSRLPLCLSSYLTCGVRWVLELDGCEATTFVVFARLVPVSISSWIQPVNHFGSGTKNRGVTEKEPRRINRIKLGSFCVLCRAVGWRSSDTWVGFPVEATRQQYMRPENYIFQQHIG